MRLGPLLGHTLPLYSSPKHLLPHRAVSIVCGRSGSKPAFLRSTDAAIRAAIMTTPPPRPASGRITPLSRPASTTLRSSLVIPTYPSVLQELVHNSLDAEASSIMIWVDASPGHELIRVEDDGCGIRAADLRRIGRRYESSKEWSGSDMGSACSYGFRGEGQRGELGLLVS